MNSANDISESAFSALMREHYGALHRYGQHFTQDEALLQDCIQDVFAGVWQNRHKLPTIEHPRQYLLTALKRRVIRVSDRDRKAVSAPTFALEFSIEDLI